MWSVLPTKRYLLLSGGKAYLREASQPLRPRVFELAVCPEEQTGEVLMALPRRRLKATLEVALGSALCRFVAMERPPSIRSDDDSSAVLRAQASRRLGFKDTEWSFVTDNRRRGHIVGCAIRKATIAKIEAWANASNHRLRSIRPLLATDAFGRDFGASGRTTLRRWAIIEEDAVSALDLGDTQLKLATFRTPPADAAHAAERMLLGLGNGRAFKTFVFAPGSARPLRYDFLDLFEEAAAS